MAVRDTEGPISGTRISVFSASGQFVRDFRVKLNLREISTFAVGNRGNLYFSIGGYVQKASAEGEPIADYAFPASTRLALDASDNLYVNRGTYSETDRISVFRPD